MAKKRITQQQLDQMDQRRRKAHLTRSARAIRELLDNTDGFRRVRTISDEDWQAATAEDSDNAP